MKNLVDIEKLLVPEILDILELRCNILSTVFTNQPIGRRVLSSKLNIGERILRKEIDVLKVLGLINVEANGMDLTKEGIEIIKEAEVLLHSIRNLSRLEIEVKEKFKLVKVIIVPGDSEEDSLVKDHLGIAAGLYLKDILKDNYKIAITGGTTIKKVVDNTPRICAFNNILVLPARGGIGKNVNIQANTLTAELAEKLGATYSLLHLDDNLSNETLNIMSKEKKVREVTENYNNIDILLYGIGKAEKMALRRGLDQEKIRKILEAGANGEAFGYYFDEKGNIVYSSTTIGIKIEQIRKIKNRIAVTAGKSKAKAIESVIKFNSDTVLITDEATARELVFYK